eukprot:jgi/Hompol1/799/HPOL_002575-RA
MPSKNIRQAFREKITLCIIILACMLVISYLAVGLGVTICPANTQRFNYLDTQSDHFTVRGSAYRMLPGYFHESIAPATYPPITDAAVFGNDLSFLFPVPAQKSVCSKTFGSAFKPFKCIVPNVWPNKFSRYDYLRYTDYIGEVQAISILTLSYSIVLDISRIDEQPNLFSQQLVSIAKGSVGGDATLAIVSRGLQSEAECLREIFRVASVDPQPFGCTVSQIIVYIAFACTLGVVGTKFIVSAGFSVASTWRKANAPKPRSTRNIRPTSKMEYYKNTPPLSPSLVPSQYVSTSVPAVSTMRSQSERSLDRRHSAIENESGEDSDDMNSTVISDGSPAPFAIGRTTSQATLGGTSSRMSYVSDAHRSERSTTTSNHASSVSAQASPSTFVDPNLPRMLVLVPCFSESEESLAKTLDSIVEADYPVSHKTILVVADGQIKGAGNNLMTHEYLIGMIDIDRRFAHENTPSGQPPEYSYVSIGEGMKRKNYARVYAGWYRSSVARNPEKRDPTSNGKSAGGSGRGGRVAVPTSDIYAKRVPIIVVHKIGTEQERAPENMPNRPGCRGKRDSQVLLMNFLSIVMLDERMTELEFELFYKLWKIGGTHPKNYETVLMIDADTAIEPDSIRHMVASFTADPGTIAVCGETMIENKTESWVTMIQVYEYFISHSYSKAFESAFGTVTCLPGCFSMYRITAPGENGKKIPILADATLVNNYAENVVETLHAKNLLLLGEDRYLSCLLLKLFPRRSLVFTPHAICSTTVPSTFKVLLSQRRRWINSTIHNQLELLLVRDLCGTFCISMQVGKI